MARQRREARAAEHIVPLPTTTAIRSPTSCRVLRWPRGFGRGQQSSGREHGRRPRRLRGVSRVHGADPFSPPAAPTAGRDLFIHNPDNLLLNIFANNSGLTVHEIDLTQWDGNSSRVVNFNGHANVTEQARNLIVAEPINKTLGNGSPADGYSYGFGPPKNVEKVACPRVPGRCSSRRA
jgi:hypothetical protein